MKLPGCQVQVVGNEEDDRLVTLAISVGKRGRASLPQSTSEHLLQWPEAFNSALSLVIIQTSNYFKMTVPTDHT